MKFVRQKTAKSSACSPKKARPSTPEKCSPGWTKTHYTNGILSGAYLRQVAKNHNTSHCNLEFEKAGNYWVLAGEPVAGAGVACLIGGNVDFAASGSLPAVSTTCCAR